MMPWMDPIRGALFSSAVVAQFSCMHLIADWPWLDEEEKEHQLPLYRVVTGGAG